MGDSSDPVLEGRSAAQPDPTAGHEEPPARPAVSVVVPFRGRSQEAQRTFDGLRRLRMRPGDEVLMVDNTPDGVAAPPVSDRGDVNVIPARAMTSSYYARNVGAEAAANDWLLFLDADCLPSPGVLDDYFGAPIPKDTGAVAGEIVAAPGPRTLAYRWATSRAHLSQRRTRDHFVVPTAVTANLLVRRAAWRAVGGFSEGVRSGGDSDFSLRLQAAGWKLGYRPQAQVAHRHREEVRALLRQYVRYGAGSAWLKRRHPGYRPLPVVRAMSRAAVGASAWTLIGRFERARLKLLDGLVALATAAGRPLDNVSPQRAPGRPAAQAQAGRGPAPPVVFIESFPEAGQAFVADELRALQAGLGGVRVEAATRAWCPDWHAGRCLSVNYLEDDGAASRLRAATWLTLRHPLRCAQDLAGRGRWRKEGEDARPLRALGPVVRRLARRGGRHVHAYPAAGGALDALRVSRLAGVPLSLSPEDGGAVHTIRAQDLEAAAAEVAGLPSAGQAGR